MRKVFLEDLPRKEGWGDNDGEMVIDWLNIVDCTVKFVYDEIEGEVDIIDYKIEGQILTIKYEGKEFNIRTSAFKKCRLGRILNKFSSNFKIEVGDKFIDVKKDIVILDRYYKERKRSDKGRSFVENQKWYRYKCNRCGWKEGNAQECDLLRGRGCSCCRGLTSVLGINTIWDTDRWMCDLGLSEDDAKRFTSGSGQKVMVECPNCREKKRMVISDMKRRKDIYCICSDSGFTKPERFVYSMLKQLKLNFETQLSKTTFKWCKNYRYDFYLNDYSCIIETHGRQHYMDVDFKGNRTKTLKKEQMNDKAKKDLAVKNAIKNYIIIDCRDSSLENMRDSLLNSELKDMFDLSNIDWLRCEAFALKNIVKEVSDYWNGKEDHETTDSIMNKFSLCKTTAISYLKKGKILGWNSYDSKIEMKKSGQKNGKKFGKAVEILKDGVLLGAFESCNELSRISLKTFGVELSGVSIARVCRGDRKTHKGFTFKYIEK